MFVVRVHFMATLCILLEEYIPLIAQNVETIDIVTNEASQLCKRLLKRQWILASVGSVCIQCNSLRYAIKRDLILEN